METPELCRYCENIPLSECEVQEHWERRLKALNLGADRGRSVKITDAEGLVTERLSPLTGKHSDTSGVPIVLPQDSEIAEVFVLESLRHIRSIATNAWSFDMPVTPPMSAPKRFWPNAESPNRSIEHKSYRMGERK